jgi:uncharacterized Zn-finger protein
VQKLGVKRALSGKWFLRIAAVTWIISALSIFLIFKNIELIVHGQLYSFGLVFSPEWADPFRFYTWMLYLCITVPTAIGGVALMTSFLKEEKIPEKKIFVEQKVKVPQQVPRVAAQPTTQAPVKKVTQVTENGNAGGISCPHCNKVFTRALVMLDFRSGRNKLVSVCPYCNHVLGNTSEEKRAGNNVTVANPNERIKTQS